MTELEQLLHDLAAAYQHAHNDLHGLTQPPATGRRTPPGPRPPHAQSVEIRGQLVTAARHLTDANWHAGGPTRPRWPGFTRLGHRHHPDTANLALRWYPALDELRVEHTWTPPATDLILHVPTPPQYTAAAQTVARQTGGIPPWDTTRTHLTRAALKRADGALRHAGGHTRPQVKICIVEYCRTPVHAHQLCRSHYDGVQAEKRRRHRQDALRRPQTA